MVTSKGVMNKNCKITNWKDLFKKYNLKYDSLSEKNKTSRRKIFLYGMASHIITDAFAHSAYKKENGVYKKIVHDIKGRTNVVEGADKIAVCPNRFVDAQKAMNRVLRHLQKGTIGEEIDFSPKQKDWDTDRGYYLGNVLKYAKACQTTWSDEDLNKAYKSVNYKIK